MWHDFLVPMCCCLRTHRLSLCKWFVISKLMLLRKAAAQTQPLQRPWLCHWHPRMGRLSWCLTGLRLASACHSSRHLGARNDHPVHPQTILLTFQHKQFTHTMTNIWRLLLLQISSAGFRMMYWHVFVLWYETPSRATHSRLLRPPHLGPTQRRACIVPLKYSVSIWCCGADATTLSGSNYVYIYILNSRLCVVDREGAV